MKLTDFKTSDINHELILFSKGVYVAHLCCIWYERYMRLKLFAAMFIRHSKMYVLMSSDAFEDIQRLIPLFEVDILQKNLLSVKPTVEYKTLL